MPNQKTGSKEEELQMAEPGRLDPSAQEARQVDRLAFTLDAETGEILKYEAVDAAGVRRELSQNERVELAKIRGGEAVEDLIERGFEAGLACLLGGADEPEDESETEEVASLRRALLGRFKRSSQHDLCWLIGETSQAPLRVFSNQASFGAAS
jgi:hypothetical protein